MSIVTIIALKWKFWLITSYKTTCSDSQSWLSYGLAHVRTFSNKPSGITSYNDQVISSSCSFLGFPHLESFKNDYPLVVTQGNRESPIKGGMNINRKIAYKSMVHGFHVWWHRAPRSDQPPPSPRDPPFSRRVWFVSPRSLGQPKRRPWRLQLW